MWGIVALFRNLLGDALRHTPAGGRVQVSAHESAAPGRVELAVADGGTGIPPELLALAVAAWWYGIHLSLSPLLVSAVLLCGRPRPDGLPGDGPSPLPRPAVAGPGWSGRRSSRQRR